MDVGQEGALQYCGIPCLNLDGKSMHFCELYSKSKFYYFQFYAAVAQYYFEVET
jgi:hypothetical protein